MSLNVKPLKRGHQVKNVQGSSNHRARRRYGSWKKLWEGKTSCDWPDECSKINCDNDAYCGSHVFIQGMISLAKVFLLNLSYQILLKRSMGIENCFEYQKLQKDAV